MMELFWLLLPLAAWSGWFIARRDGDRRMRHREQLPKEYFKGLNYLISEQPDKAIEVFTRMVEVDSETVETHLALGNLFRRRGEVDRAIRIHQNLIARPTLSRELRAQALLELGGDYLRAGLLDRAESLFEQVIEFGVHIEEALRQLLVIYQQEKEWQKAIEAGMRLESRAGAAMRAVIAQFYCELAQTAMEQGDASRVRQLLKRALAQDPNCARASIQLGQLEMAHNNPKAALRAFQRVMHQDPEFLPEVLPAMRQCHEQLGTQKAMMRYLEEVRVESAGPAPMLMLAELIREQDGVRAAIDFVAEELRQRPSVYGLHRLIELTSSAAETAPAEGVEVLHNAFTELLSNRPAYECRQCGFTAKALYWQCPSCKSWATVKPISGL